jgi:hypothetical protein
VTGRCYDFPGPAEPAIATSRGWVPFNEQDARELALSGMLLAFSPEHVDRLQNEQPGRAASALQAPASQRA